MDLNEYQDAAQLTAMDPNVLLTVSDHPDQTDYKHIHDGDWVYVALGLGSEVGELQGILKKVIRDNKGFVSPEDRERLKFELGDVLWYVAMVAYRFHFYLGDIAEANLRKLASRQRRGTLGGNGDDR